MSAPQPHRRAFSLLLLSLFAMISVEVAGCAQGGASDGKNVTGNQPQMAVARDISDVELVGLMAERPDLLIIDVRTDREWEGGHIAGACFLDFLEDDFRDRATMLPKDRPIALYCAAGGRSEDAMNLLSKAGFPELYNLRGGFYGWEDAGRPISNDPPVDLPEAD